MIQFALSLLLVLVPSLLFATHLDPRFTGQVDPYLLDQHNNSGLSAHELNQRERDCIRGAWYSFVNPYRQRRIEGEPIPAGYKSWLDYQKFEKNEARRAEIEQKQQAQLEQVRRQREIEQEQQRLNEERRVNQQRQAEQNQQRQIQPQPKPQVQPRQRIAQRQQPTQPPPPESSGPGLGTFLLLAILAGVGAFGYWQWRLWKDHRIQSDLPSPTEGR